MKRIPEFDGVRAVAVSLVLLDHYAPFRTLAHGAPARYGGAGVDIFFVLSGFLITTILLRSRTDSHPLRTFYVRRALRILPAYAVLLVVVFAAGALLREPFRMSVLGEQLLFLRSFKGTDTLLHQSAYFLQHPSALPGLFRLIAPAPVLSDYAHLPMTGSLGPTWSLSVEEWFYVLWAPIALLVSRRSLGIIAAAFCAIGLLLRSLPHAGTSFFTSFDILLSGGLLALWIEQRPRLSAPIRLLLDRALAAVSSLSAVMLVLLWLLHRDLLSRTLLELAIAGALAWLLQHSGENHPVARFFRLRPLVYVGSISYMIYLLHLPLYFLVRHMVEAHVTGLSSSERLWMIALSSCTATLLCSTASWFMMEKPLLEHKDRITAFLVSGRRATLSVRVAEIQPGPVFKTAAQNAGSSQSGSLA